MADKVAACVREVVAIASGDGAVGDRRKAAEQRVAKLLKVRLKRPLVTRALPRIFATAWVPRLTRSTIPMPAKCWTRSSIVCAPK